MRTFAKYLLSVVGALLVFIALSGASAWLLVGTADHATATVMSVISDEAAGRAAGDLLVESLADSADPVVRARLKDESGLLAGAAAAGLRASEAAISTIIDVVYRTIESGSKERVDLEPVYAKVLAELHRVDGSIPASPSDAIDASGGEALTVEVDGSILGPVRTVLGIIGAWWIPFLLALGLLVLAGLCDTRAPIRRWRVSGISLAVPSGLLLVASLLGGSVVAGAIDSETSTLVGSVVSVVKGTLVRLSALTLILAIAIIVVTLVVKPRAASEPGPDPETAEPQADAPSADAASTDPTSA